MCLADIDISEVQIGVDFGAKDLASFAALRFGPLTTSQIEALRTLAEHDVIVASGTALPTGVIQGRLQMYTSFNVHELPPLPPRKRDPVWRESRRQQWRNNQARHGRRR